MLIDPVERSDALPAITRLRVEPILPLGVDVNVVLAERSRELRQFLRCEVPMPAPASPNRLRPPRPMVTVCEKLASRRP